jgi:hypothetical protein
VLLSAMDSLCCAGDDMCRMNFPLCSCSLQVELNLDCNMDVNGIDAMVSSSLS